MLEATQKSTSRTSEVPGAKVAPVSPSFQENDTPLQEAEESAVIAFQQCEKNPEDHLTSLRALAKSYRELNSKSSEEIAEEIEISIVVREISLTNTYLEQKEPHLALEALISAFKDYKCLKDLSQQKRMEILSGISNTGEVLLAHDHEQEFAAPIEALYREMHEHTLSITHGGPSRLLWLTSLCIADISLFNGQHDNCLTWNEQALTNLGREPENDDLRALVFCRSAEAHMGKGDFLQAISFSEQAIALVKDSFKNDPELLTTVYRTAGEAEKMANNPHAAKSYFETAASYAQTAEYPEKETAIQLLGDLAELCRQLGETERYIGALRSATELAEEHLGKEHPTTIELLRELAMYYSDNQEETRALDILDSLLETTKATYGERSLEHLEVVLELADTANAFGLKDVNARYLDSALELSSELAEEEQALRQEILSRMGHLLYELGDAGGANLYHNRAVELGEQLNGQSPLSRAEALANRSAFRESVHGTAEALPDALKAYELLVGFEHTHPSSIAHQAFDVAELYGDLENWQSAEKFYRTAIQYFDRCPDELKSEVAVAAKLKLATLSLEKLSDYSTDREQNRAINLAITALSEAAQTTMEDSWEVFVLLEVLDAILPEYDERRGSLNIKDTLERLSQIHGEEDDGDDSL